jgi:hypothetical protein
MIIELIGIYRIIRVFIPVFYFVTIFLALYTEFGFGLFAVP